MIQDIVNLLKKITLAHLITYDDKELSLVICAIMNTVDYFSPDEDALIKRIENCLGIEYAPAGKEEALKAIQEFRDKLPVGSNIDFYIPIDFYIQDGKKEIWLILRNYNDSSEVVIPVKDIIAEMNKKLL